MSEEEQVAVTAFMRESASAVMGSGSTNAAGERSLNAGYICAAKMHESHQHFGQVAFFSDEFQYHVCGATLQIERRQAKDGRRHRCKMGPPSTIVGPE